MRRELGIRRARRAAEEFLKRFGANGLTVGGSEVPSALERGVVDGVLTANAGGGKIWKDLLKYNYEIGLNYFEDNLVVNKEAYAKLPAAYRDSLTRAIVVRWATYVGRSASASASFSASTVHQIA